MGQIRLELMTPALSERCSNQLSYCPSFWLIPLRIYPGARIISKIISNELTYQLRKFRTEILKKRR